MTLARLGLLLAIVSTIVLIEAIHRIRSSRHTEQIDTLLIAIAATIASISSWMGAAEADANASLIAAAPDLYEALRNLPDFSDGFQLVRWLDTRAAAIAKAEGR